MVLGNGTVAHDAQRVANVAMRFRGTLLVLDCVALGNARDERINFVEDETG